MEFIKINTNPSQAQVTLTDFDYPSQGHDGFHSFNISKSSETSIQKGLK
jgi:hypothetical protein